MMSTKNCILQFLFTILVCNSFAYEVFEDVAYEPSSIKYEGLSTPQIAESANRAFVAIKNYHSRTAQEIFDSILLIDKHNVLGVYGLAYCKFADGDYENSIEILTPLINVNTKNGALYSLRGRNYMVLENLPAAIDDFRKACEYNNDEKDRLSLSQCLFYSGDFAASTAEADKYIQVQATKPDGYYVKGLAQSELKEYVAANETLKKAVDIDPENSASYVQMSRNYLELKEANKAMKNINKAIEADSKNSQALDLRAELKYINHDYANAIIDCNTVIKLDNELKYAYLTRGKSYLKLGLKKDACADLKKAVELGNTDAQELMVKNCN